MANHLGGYPSIYQGVSGNNIFYGNQTPQGPTVTSGIKLSSRIITAPNVAAPPGGSPVPVTTYFLTSTTGAATLVTPSFTPDAGEIIVVKATGEFGGGGGSSLPVGTGLTFTKHQEINPGSQDAHAAIWSATVGGSPSSMTITVDNNAATNWSTVVERWPAGTTLGTLVVSSGAQGSGAPLTNITTTAANSTISWASADWNAVAPGTPTYRDGPVQEAIHDRSPSNYVAYYAYQAAPTAGAQSFGMTSPAGQKWSAVGIEIKAAPDSTPNILEALEAEGSGAPISVTTSVATPANAVLVVFHGNNWNTLANVTAPTTGGPWTFGAGGDAGTDTAHAKLWTGLAAGGAQTITVQPTASGEEHTLHVIVLSVGSTVDGTPQGFADPTSSSLHTAPSVPDVSGTASLLLCMAQGNHGPNGTYNAPPAMVELTDVSDSTFGCTGSVAYQILTVSGATGTKVFSPSSAAPFAAVSIAIKGVAGGGGGGPITRTVNQITETDTAQPIARQKIKTIGQVTETDSAQPIKVLRSRTVVQVTETDTPQAISKRKIKAVLQATETDTPQTVTKLKIKPVLQTQETDSAQTITRITPFRMVNQVTETDTAQTITVRKIKTIGQVIETDSTQTIIRQHRRTLGQPVETDTVTGVAKRKIKAVGQTVETDSAQRIVIQGRVFQVTETDTAQKITVVKRKTVLQVTETDTVTAISRRKVRTVGQTVETDTAALIVKPGNKLILLASEVDTAQKITVIKRKTLGQLIETDLATVITPRRTRRFNVGLTQEVDTVTVVRARKLVHVIQVTETDLARIINFSSVLPPPPDGYKVLVTLRPYATDVIVNHLNNISPTIYITDVTVEHLNITVVL